MPPYEINGKQVEMVDAAGQPIASERTSWRNGRRPPWPASVYAPEIGFETVRNIGSGEKYPYNPFYKAFSPRVSAAWNPRFTRRRSGQGVRESKTVIRGGYARIYGRTNGVDLVLVPLLGPGHPPGRIVLSRRQRHLRSREQPDARHRIPHRHRRHLRRRSRRFRRTSRNPTFRA